MGTLRFAGGAFVLICGTFLLIVFRRESRQHKPDSRREMCIRDRCNIVAPNFLWFKKIRGTPWLLFIWSLIVLVGMWLERYVIIVSSLAQDNLVSSWRVFQGTRWDWATYLGTIGLFLFLFFLFIRLLPMISIFEIRTLLPQAKVETEAGEDRG